MIDILRALANDPNISAAMRRAMRPVNFAALRSMLPATHVDQPDEDVICPDCYIRGASQLVRCDRHRHEEPIA